MTSPRETNRAAVLAAEAAGVPRFDALPLRVTMELSADCNLRCPHCEFTPPRALAEKKGIRPSLEISPEDLRLFAGAVFPHIEVLVPSVVGEPMMYSHWDLFLDLLEEHGVFAEVVTNGTYLDRERLERMGPVTSRIRVSMDGASPKTFDKLRAPARFEEVVPRLRALRDWRRGLAVEERPEVWIETVLTTHWIDELVDMVRLAAELEVDGVGVAHVVAYNAYWQQHHPGEAPEASDAAMRAAAEEAARLGVSLALPKLFGSGENLSLTAGPILESVPKVAEPAPPEDGRPYYCKYLWRELFVALNGDVSACCGQGRPTVGNLREDFDVAKHFLAPEMVAMRAGTISGRLHPACATCPQLAMYGTVSYDQADFRGEYGALEGLRRE